MSFMLVKTPILSGLVALTAGIALEAQHAPLFRAGVDLVSLNVTVTGPDRRHLTDLSAQDFAVFEDGRPQELTFFSQANTALSVSLLLDSSSSMKECLPLVQKAATEFVAKLRPGDLAEVVDFDGRVEVLQPFTSDRSLLEAAIQRTHADGSTSLYNAVYIALRELDDLRAQARDEIRREVIVVLSDGEDTSSTVDFDKLLRLTKRSQTVIYTIGLDLEAHSSRVARPLRRLAQETGGRLFTPRQLTDLSDVYTQITNELASQYVLGYLSSNGRRDDGWHSITVRVRRPALQARTRPGYYALAE